MNERLPALNVTGNVGLASAKFDDSGKQEQWAIGLGLSMPIFDGFLSLPTCFLYQL